MDNQDTSSLPAMDNLDTSSLPAIDNQDTSSFPARDNQDICSLPAIDNQDISMDNEYISHKSRSPYPPRYQSNGTECEDVENVTRLTASKKSEPQPAKQKSAAWQSEAEHLVKTHRSGHVDFTVKVHIVEAD